MPFGLPLAPPTFRSITDGVFMLIDEYTDGHFVTVYFLPDIKAKVGDSWVGSFVYHNCSSAKFSNLRFELKKFERKPNMMSLADVSAMLFWDDNTDADVTFIDSLPYDGTYKFYSRSAHFEINYGGQLFQEVFYFIPGETNIMHYDVYFANSQKICARAYLKKT